MVFCWHLIDLSLEAASLTSYKLQVTTANQVTMADEHINDSAYSDTSYNQDDLPVDDVLHDTDDSGYTLDFIFDDDIIDIFQDEPLPSLEEFIDEVQ